MRRGLVQDYANQIPQIFVGWRLLVSPGDLPLLLARGQGQLRLNLLTGTAQIDGSYVSFAFADELQEWLKERAELDGLGWTAIERADLTVDFACEERPGRKMGVLVRQLDFKCTMTLDAAGGHALSTRVSQEVGVKEGDGPWVVH